MKVCQMCNQKIATTTIRTNIDGMPVSLYVCPSCAAKIDNSSNEGIHSLEELFDLFGLNDDEEYTTQNVKKCKCGMTEQDIIESGKFGCSECYKTFPDLVNRYVYKLGGKTYAGKIPKFVCKNAKVENQQSIRDQIDELTKLKQQAVSKEDYVSANKYKSQIDELMKKYNKE